MPENSDHSCDENCQECRKLQLGQTETILFVYGYIENGVMMSRATAVHLAEYRVGQTITTPGQLLKIVSIHLEDDTPDGTKGRVIAICELVERDN